MIRSTARVAFASLLAIGLGTAVADEPTSKEFVKEAVESNLAEIQASQLALSKSNNPEVKTFAQQMVDNHTTANNQLQAVAEHMGIKIPYRPDLTHQAALERLRSESSASFDKSYIEQMSKDHEKAIELFQGAANSAQIGQELKALAQETLPILHQHQHTVMQLAGGETAGTRR